MKFKTFTIYATPSIGDAYCECNKRLMEVSNGWFGIAMFCKECKSVYELELRKVNEKKIPKEFLEQCEQELMMKNKGDGG